MKTNFRNSFMKLVDLDKGGDLDIVITNYAGANKIYIHNHSGSNYLNRTAPGKTPVLFAPATISTVGNNEHTLSVAPDGKYFFFTKYNARIKEGDIYWVSAAIIDSLRK
jgi:hypothetical protein